MAYCLKGDLFISDGESMSSWNDLECTCEIATDSINEYAETLLRINGLSQGSLSYDINGVDLAALNRLTQPLAPLETFWFEYDSSIMIQKRWHKKKRINKKWLRRFGMKLDTVRVRKEGRALTYDRASGDVEFETTNKTEYIWRQDQLRKYLKIEWYNIW